ncbi:hypothetical protein [Brachybacterium sp. SW0106-09]|nr:hypothetical protein [Brachybacterium sp. SW0106-09]
MRGWTTAAEAYDRSFVTLCDGTAARVLADLPAGELLDVGCGTGHLAERVAHAGRTVRRRLLDMQSRHPAHLDPPDLLELLLPRRCGRAASRLGVASGEVSALRAVTPMW